MTRSPRRRTMVPRIVVAERSPAEPVDVSYGVYAKRCTIELTDAKTSGCAGRRLWMLGFVAFSRQSARETRGRDEGRLEWPERAEEYSMMRVNYGAHPVYTRCRSRFEWMREYPHAGDPLLSFRAISRVCARGTLTARFAHTERQTLTASDFIVRYPS